jgi:hypothetical protein
LEADAEHEEAGDIGRGSEEESVRLSIPSIIAHFGSGLSDPQNPTVTSDPGIKISGK